MATADRGRSREALGTSKGVLTPAGAIVGLGRVLWQNLLRPARLAPIFLLQPFRLHKRLDALNIDVCGEAVKFFAFSMLVLFALGGRLNLGFLDIFKMNTVLDAFIFEISIALVLLIWSNVQYFFLRSFSSQKKLFQGVLTINAGFFAFILFLACVVSILFDITRLFLPWVFPRIGTTADVAWDWISGAYLYVYLPLMFYLAYVNWMARALNITRLTIILSLVVALLAAGTILYASLETVKTLLDHVRSYVAPVLPE